MLSEHCDAEDSKQHSQPQAAKLKMLSKSCPAKVTKPHSLSWGGLANIDLRRLLSLCPEATSHSSKLATEIVTSLATVAGLTSLSQTC